MSDDDKVCPCDAFVHPHPISNPPGRDAIDYRPGDYASFRSALLRVVSGEEALAGWQPSAEGDLGLQLLEWWAYLADVLTFYNERGANGAYLRTACDPASVKRLVNLLGYRPRPAMGATGKLGALIGAKAKVTVPLGLPLQNKSGPGQQPQVFEVDEIADALPQGALDVDPVAATLLKGPSVLLKGTISGVQPLDQLLLVQKNWNQTTSGYEWMTVASVAQEKDPRGQTNTRITFTAPPTKLLGTPVKNCRLLRSTLETRLYVKQNAPPDLVLFNDAPFGAAHLVATARDMSVGNMALLVSKQGCHLAWVTEYKEVVWYENGPYGSPDDYPAPPAIPLPNLHAEIYFQPMLVDMDNVSNPLSTYRVLYGFADVGMIIDEAPAEVNDATLTLSPRGPVPPSLTLGSQVFIEGADGAGSIGKVKAVENEALKIQRDPASPALKTPLRILYNLLSVSRGKTVSKEVLGDGDATQAGQSFTLQKSPLTYFPGAAPGSTRPYHSTLRVLVDGIAWTEVESFYDQPADARVFTTREDVDGETHILFGDGVHGARLPTGKANIVASYRHGAGAESPPAGSLTVLLDSIPGLSSVRSPVPAGGGSDAESPAAIRRAGPRSVLTFGRAISRDDYEAIALAAGAKRARAYFAWDSALQRAVVKLYVGDDAGATDLARAALAPAVDPNRPFLVLPAVPKKCKLEIVIIADERYDGDALEPAVRGVLLDPDTGLFSASIARIGDAIYDSNIIEACLRVPGAIAVPSIDFSCSLPDPSDEQTRHAPGEGGFFSLEEQDLVINIETAGAQS